MVRYLQNKDSSIISQKTFNDGPDNMYPTFSICLKGNDIYWRNEQDLFDMSGMTSLQYSNMLKGENGLRYKYNETTRLYFKEHINDSSILKLEYTGMFLQSSDVIVGTHFLALDNIQSTRYGYGERAANLQDIPFHIGHQAADEICFTRNSSFESGLKRVYDEVLLNRMLLNTGNHRRLETKIIFHYPGQLIERLNSPTHQIKLENMDHKNMFWEGKITQVSVLKNRPDHFLYCYDGIVSDDTRFRYEVIRNVKCLPPYWKNIDHDNDEMNFCESIESFKEIQNMISSYKETLKDRSCTSMATLVLQDKTFREDVTHITIKVSYMEQSYQETENIQDFSFESFFSSLGGFIGIFLGYSMLQIPELLNNIPLITTKLKVSPFIGNSF